jgi:peptidoglycan glycosyltransferase
MGIFGAATAPFVYKSVDWWRTIHPQTSVMKTLGARSPGMWHVVWFCTAAFLMLFVLLLIQVNYIQVFAAQSLINNPANATRLIIAEYQVDRGTIYARDGSTILAQSKPTGDQLNYLRTYPNGERYADITGYYSFIYGTSDLEQSQNDYLSGRNNALLQQTLLDQIRGEPKQGASITTTIDPKLQQVAAKAMNGLPGAVVAMNPQTGEVLALVSIPSYDPNTLSSHDSKAIHASWTRLNRDKQKPLLSKADSELYPPGSNFKMVTAAAALENGYGPDSVWPNPSALTLPQTSHQLQNFGGEHCLGGAPTITLSEAFTISCNVVFGEVGLKVGAQALSDQAYAFGSITRPPRRMPPSSAVCQETR